MLPSSSFYTSNDAFDSQMELFASKGLYYLGGLEELKHRWQAVSTKGAVREDLIIQLKDGRIKAFPNLCTHRAAQLLAESSDKDYLTCPYHGRRFDENGECVFMPFYNELENFPSKRDHLSPLPTVQLGPLCFAKLNQESRESKLQQLTKLVSFFDFDHLIKTPTHKKSYEVDAHWALYVENYLEGFHIPFVHPGLNRQIEFHAYETIIEDPFILQLGPAKDDQISFKMPLEHPWSKKNIYGCYIYLFPNLMFNLYPWGLSLNVVNPINPGKTVVDFISYKFPEFGDEIIQDSALHQTEMEDEKIVESSMRGIRSRYFSGYGTLHPKWEEGVVAFHQMIQDHEQSGI